MFCRWRKTKPVCLLHPTPQAQIEADFEMPVSPTARKNLKNLIDTPGSGN